MPNHNQKAKAVISIFAVVASTGISINAANAETFSIGSFALNTNNNIRRYDGFPEILTWVLDKADPDQHFDRATSNFSNAYMLKNRTTQGCINSHYGVGSKTNVWSPCNAKDPDMGWKFLVQNDGTSLIQNVRSGLCLQMPTNKANYGIVTMQSCNGGDSNQRWSSNAGNVTSTNGAEAFLKWAIGQTNIARLDTGLYKGECVSLIARYIAEAYLPANQKNQSMTLGNGKDVASTVARIFSQYFESLTNQGLPKRGAVISFPGISAPYGHVAIVMSSQQLSNGQRQVKIMDSNGPQGRVVKEQTWWINIPDGRAQGYGSGIVWTNPTK